MKKTIIMASLFALMGVCYSSEHKYTSGFIYGEIPPSLLGHWKQNTAFYGMEMTLNEDKSIKFTSFSEREQESPSDYFALVENDTITIIFPDTFKTLTYSVVPIDNIFILMSEIEVGRYRALKGPDKDKFIKEQLSFGRLRIDDEKKPIDSK